MSFNTLHGAHISTTTSSIDTIRNHSIDIGKQILNSLSYNLKAEVFTLKPWEFYLYIGFGISSPIMFFLLCVCCCCYKDYILNSLSCLLCCKEKEEKNNERKSKIM